MAVCVLCLFLTVPWPWVGLQSVIVTFPGHTNLFLITVRITSSAKTNSLKK